MVGLEEGLGLGDAGVAVGAGVEVGDDEGGIVAGGVGLPVTVADSEPDALAVGVALGLGVAVGVGVGEGVGVGVAKMSVHSKS